MLKSCMPAERDPGPIIPARIEGQLFSALDRETDAASAAQLQATIQTLLAAGASARPSHYLAACSSVILAATAAVDSKTSAAQKSVQGRSSSWSLRLPQVTRDTGIVQHVCSQIPHVITSLYSWGLCSQCTSSQIVALESRIMNPAYSCPPAIYALWCNLA